MTVIPPKALAKVRKAFKTVTPDEAKAAAKAAKAPRKPKQGSLFGAPKASRTKSGPKPIPPAPRPTEPLGKTITITILGEPVPWSASQIVRGKNNTRVHGVRTKRLQGFYDRAVPELKRQWIRPDHGRRHPIGHAIRVDILAVFARDSLPKDIAATLPDRACWHEWTPDASNIRKAVEDACTQSGVWLDDCLIVEGDTRKVVRARDGGLSPGLYITIRPIRTVTDATADLCEGWE